MGQQGPDLQSTTIGSKSLQHTEAKPTCTVHACHETNILSQPLFLDLHLCGKMKSQGEWKPCRTAHDCFSSLSGCGLPISCNCLLMTLIAYGKWQMLSYTQLSSGAMRLADQILPSLDFSQVIIYLQHTPGGTCSPIHTFCLVQ